MTNFKIENFCNDHHLEFKKYYNYLNNPFYLSILLKCLQYIDHERVKNKIYSMIIENKKNILEKLEIISILIKFYKKNNLINKSEIGYFFIFYENELKKINKNNNKDLLKLFYKLIHYKRCISVLKECFYIYSDYRACIYFMTPSINFYDTKKEKVDEVVKNFKDNINTLNQIITKIYIYDKSPWGSKYYTSAYIMFETLLILKKYYNNPLKKLDITFTIKEKCNNKNIIKDLCNSYSKLKMKSTTIDNKMNEKYINNVSQFIINLKNMGYDMWFVIILVFNVIYKSYNLLNIMEPLVISHEKIYYQKMNNKIGIMCFILVNDNFISNVNIFRNFND
jgi:hypothetical protein